MLKTTNYGKEGLFSEVSMSACRRFMMKKKSIMSFGLMLSGEGAPRDPLPARMAPSHSP